MVELSDPPKNQEAIRRLIAAAIDLWETIEDEEVSVLPEDSNPE